MYIIPAIDLMDGKCVRLIQGQYDPIEQASEFISAGAQWLHIVDLDGAKAGKPVNTAIISAIVKLKQLKVEVGGGIRDEVSIRQLLDIGIERVIIGTKAVSNFEWFSQMTETFKYKLVLGLDAKGSNVATHGWTQGSSEEILAFAVKASKLPIAAIIYTDIARDGMMTGPNLERTKAIIEALDIPVIASGGVTQISDIKKLSQIGAAAVIIGRSLYEGTLNLADAIGASK
jgi:phosphoribosylformimino-5-aminoimidazole carboxamide ribotide isomerase